MKTIKSLLIAVLCAAVPVFASAQDKTKSVETVKFSTSITCSACVNTIMTSLPREKGIKDVKCNLKTKEVTVVYQKDKSNADEIQKKIEKLGFTAKAVKAVEPTIKKDK